MTYSASSPLTGTGIATAGQIDAWIRQRTPTAPPVGGYVVAWADTDGICSDIVAAQIVHETGWLTSGWFTQHNNPAGLGVTGAPGAGLSFPGVSSGIEAQCAHLADYCRGAGPWTPQDPRPLPADLLGSVHVLADLDGRWAVPGNGYGAALAALANDLIGGAVSIPSGRDPDAIWAPSSNLDTGRAGYHIDHITAHLTAGTNSLSWLQGTAGGSANTASSATYLVSRDGTVHQLVSEDDTAWADGNLLYNRTGISIEHEALVGEGFASAQIAATIALQTRICQRLGWTSLTHPSEAVLPEAGVPGSAVLIGHYQVPDPTNPAIGGGIDHHLECPGPLYPWDSITSTVNTVLAGKAAAPVAPADPPLPALGMQTWTDPVTHVTVYGGILARFLQLQGALATISPAEILMVWGHPVAPERVDPDGVTRQDFEHVTAEWHPGVSPPRYDILEQIIHGVA